MNKNGEKRRRDGEKVGFDGLGRLLRESGSGIRGLQGEKSPLKEAKRFKGRNLRGAEINLLRWIKTSN